MPRFAARKSTELKFARKLRQVAKEVGRIVKAGHDPSSLAIDLAEYADRLDPWAHDTAFEIVNETARINALDWRDLARELSLDLTAVARPAIEDAVSMAIAELTAEGARLIKSLPLEASEQVVQAAQTAVLSGRRYTDIMDYVLEHDPTPRTRARAELIARTECARQNSILTQTRAVSAGSEGYIWRTAEDGRVRPTHAALNGRFIRWDDPPECDPGHHAHAGQIWNCRCWAEPVFSVLDERE